MQMHWRMRHRQSDRRLRRVFYLRRFTKRFKLLTRKLIGNRESGIGNPSPFVPPPLPKTYLTSPSQVNRIPTSTLSAKSNSFRQLSIVGVVSGRRGRLDIEFEIIFHTTKPRSQWSCKRWYKATFLGCCLRRIR